MFRNYFKTAWRNLLKNKVFTAINISGLSLGITCSILIFLWVYDEYQVDHFHKNLDRLYIVTSQEYMDGEVEGTYDTPGLLGEELPLAMPDVEKACGYGWIQYHTFAVGEKKAKFPGNYAGPDFFTLFSYPLLEGQASSAINNKDDIAISEKMAIAFFGSARAAMDGFIKFDNYRQLHVKAVFRDVPENSSQRFDYVLSWDFFLEHEPWAKDWHNSGPTTFVLLKAHADAKAVDARLRTFLAKYDKEYRENDRLELGLQPYGEKYLHGNFRNGHIDGGRIQYVRLFTLVALFILLIACINYMNLSTARSIKRSREIGVRKVVGAGRASLVGQFLGEALLFTVIAVTVSCFLVLALLPLFNQLTGKQISLPADKPGFWISVAGLALATGLIAGSYPSLLLSSFRPIAILKNTLRLGPSALWLRKGLVVFQFTLCVAFIISMLIISNQVNYIYSKNLGYQKKNLLFVPITGSLGTSFDVFKEKARNIPGIEEISQASQRPLEIENTTTAHWEGQAPGSSPRFTQMAVGYDFVKTMQAHIVMGRDFSPNYGDSANYIINETAMKKIGFPDPVGKQLDFWGIKGAIVGVVQDFNFNSLHEPVSPIIIRLTGFPAWGVALVRVNPGQMTSAIASLKKLHAELNPEFPFNYQFADEEYAALYESEQLVKSLSRYFVLLSIVISCIGLLGLVLFAAEQRTREIGIRKVLGASVYSLVELLSREFLVLVGIAFLIAVPLAWWLMHVWLQGFAYRVPVGPGEFILAGVSVLVITLLTISYQAIRAAIANPVKALRTE